MGKNCCGFVEDREANNDPLWRRILWIALILNAVMFGVEIVAGLAADSRALQADALDFLGDAANYAISLGVAGMAVAWRDRAAIAKAGAMLAFGLWVLGSAIWGFFVGASPDAGTMGIIGTVALAVNLAVAAMLFRFRMGDANMRSVWVCSRNDAIGNAAVVVAAGLVAWTASPWPDLVVAVIIAGLFLQSSWSIIRDARSDLRETSSASARAPA